MSAIAAVVVHFRSYETVGDTVERLLAEGLPSPRIVVVDNSEEPDRREDLRRTIPTSVEILYERNRGYGAAVNRAVRYFSESDIAPTHLLVATHETRPQPGAIQRLADALERDPLAAVAGPTLVTGETSEIVWSTGGRFTRGLKLPDHFDHRESLADLPKTGSPRRRAWLDGAFLLYRWRDIRDNLVSEDFFVYMEETDLHLRLASQGRHAIWVPSAVVWQSSGGVPSFYFSRNLRLLFLRHASRTQRAVTIPIAIGRRVLSDLKNRRGMSSTAALLKGALVRLPPTARWRPREHVVIVNPLGAALGHYAEELTHVIEASGGTTDLIAIDEPSSSGRSKLSWLSDYVVSLRLAASRTRRVQGSRVLVVWPVLGYWDLVLLRLFCSRATLIVHDPRPLVSAVGHGTVARRVARVVSQNRIKLLTHSSAALRLVEQDMPFAGTATVAHPILEPITSPEDASQTVRVLGQYKADRDLEALRYVGERLTQSFALEIAGRRWPEIDGWSVDSRFVEEAELDRLISSSVAVLIPYSRFFQSGIAIRCLERGVPFIGPRSSSLADLVGPDSPLLVTENEPSDWMRAITVAGADGRMLAEGAGRGWYDKALSDWSAWLRGR